MEKKENMEIAWINNPEDILGIGIKNLLNYRYEEPKFHNAVEKFNQVVVFDFEDLYPISVHFQKPIIEILPFNGKSHNLKLKISLNTLISIMRGDYSIVGAFVRGKIKSRQWWKFLSIIQLLRILIPAMHRAKERAEEYGK
ncbi:MAG: hypothetical protein JW776_16640 [Candidatus Lokiarchaeota archaeon]|nr:hypothetical protein [Candidatus Lokiarchaeota archaeon]